MTESMPLAQTSLAQPFAIRARVPWGVLGLALILLGYCIFLALHFAPAISEPDDNGYFAQGTLMAQTARTWFVPESDAQYIGMHWLITPMGHYISRYPPGLAGIIGAVYFVGGWKASLLVNPALSVLALVGLFVLLRRLLSTGWALCGVVLLAANPVFCHHALSGDSHMAVACCVTWGCYLLFRWSEEGLLWQAFAAGLVFGIIPSIRYPDAIMGLGVAAFLLWNARRFDRIHAHWLAAVCGAAVTILPLLLRNQLVLGAFWKTGYSLTNEQTGFAWKYFRDHALGYVNAIHSGGMGLVFALGVIGIVYMICTRAYRAMGIMFALFAVPMLLLYMAYYWAPQMNSSMTMRFLLPTFPAYLIAGVFALRQFLAAAPKGARVAVPVTLVAVQLLWGAADLLNQVTRLHHSKRVLAIATEAMEKVAVTGDVVVGNNQVLQQFDFVRKWKVADASVMRADGGRMMGGPGPMGPDMDSEEPSPMQLEKRALQQGKYPGTAAQRQAKFVADLLSWAQGHRIYYIGTEQEMSNLISTGKIRIVARVPLPEAPQMATVQGRMGPRGAGGRGGFGPPQGGFRGRGGMPGGPGGPGGPMGGFAGEKELIIAEWDLGPRS